MLEDQHRAIHQRTARAWIDQLGKLTQDLGHLVAALAATHVDDDVGFREARERLLDHRLAGAKAARQCDGAALGNGEEQVEDPLTRHEGSVGRQALGHGARSSHGPAVRELEGRSIGEASEGLVHAIRTVGDLLELAGSIGRQHHPVLHGAALFHEAQDVAPADPLARLSRRPEAPARIGIERRRRATRRQEVALASGQYLQRPPDPVEHRTQKPGTERNREWAARRLDRFAHRQAAGLLEDLDGGGVSLDADHLAHQPPFTHANQLIERTRRQRRCLRDRAHHACDSRRRHRRRNRYDARRGGGRERGR
jgi:hypothetical protein